MPLLFSELKNITPQFQNRFKIVINLTDELKNLLSQKENTLELETQTSITLPDLTVETLEIPSVSYNLKQQSSITFGEEVTISLVEKPNFYYRNLFQKWIDVIFNYLNVSMQVPSKYKQPSLVVTVHQKMIPTNSNNKQFIIDSQVDFNVLTYRFVNVYPTSIQGNDLDYGNVDLVTRDVVFRFDYFEEFYSSTVVLP